MVNGVDSNAVAAWARHLVVQRVFRKVAEALTEAGVRVLPVKGVVTARLLYGDPAARPVRDVDLRVAPRDLRAALAVARAHGWESRRDSPRLHEAVLYVDGWEIDIECTFGPPGLCVIGIADLIARAHSSIDPFPHLEPELHDHALILALNAFKDGLQPMPWSLEDLRRIVRHAGFHCSALVARAREGRVLSALWVVADWLSGQKGALEWRAVRDEIGARPPSAPVTRAYSYVRQRGWSPKAGLVAAASSSDVAWRRVTGLALTALGIARRRLVLTLRSRHSGRKS